MAKTVLVVDDNQNDVLLLQRIMRRHGLVNPVQVLGTGEDAISYLAGVPPYSDRKRFPFPAIVFLDLLLPCRSGTEVLEWLQRHPELPPFEKIIYTDVTLFPELQKCHELGATAFLLKEEQENQFQKLLKKFPEVWEYRYPEEKRPENL